MIKHLVLSGGGWKGFYMMGAIDNLLEKKYFNIEEIESIWGTSVGSLIGIMLCLKIDWSVILEFCKNIKFKTEDYEKINFDTFIKIYKTCGYLNKDYFNPLENLFLANKLDMNTITLKEFYDFSGKDLHIFSVKYEDFETRDFNHKTDPDIKLMDAIYCSCCIPIVFEPMKIEDEIYLDGGININFPTEKCIENNNLDEILGIFIKTLDKKIENLNLVTFTLNLLYKLIFKKQNNCLNLLKNQLIIQSSDLYNKNILENLNKKEVREGLINEGRGYSFIYLNTKN
jgi:predicted acylesterase/phospholipase RssA